MQQPLIPPFSLPHIPLIAGGLTVFLLCWLIILSGKWHGHYSHDDTSGIQKFHVEPTPRIGGVAIMLGVLVGWREAPPLVDEILLQIFLASIPAFVFGLTEDLTRRVSVKARLIATMISGVLACVVSGVSLQRVGIYGIDEILSLWLLSVAFTAIAVAGIANAINMIDGFNGLATGVVLICLGSLGYTSYLANDVVLAKVCFVLAGMALGFFLVNFPMGRIFLGDGGAYVLGFWLAWISIMLVMRNQAVSPWSAVLACAYPITETLFSVYRRSKRGVSPGSPDRLHLHSLIKIRVVRKRFPKIGHAKQNPLVSAFIWCIAITPAAMAPMFYKSTLSCIIILLVYVLLYTLTYRRLIRFKF